MEVIQELVTRSFAAEVDAEQHDAAFLAEMRQRVQLALSVPGGLVS